MSRHPGAFTVVLHTHLPWVLHHGRWPHGSDWLCEAVAECYLPLLAVLEPRALPGRPLGITLGMSPVLCEQLAHPDFAVEFRSYLSHRQAAGREDAQRFGTEGRPREAALARRWAASYADTLAQWNAAPDLIARFRRLAERGAIEIITTAATHAYLPLLATAAAVERQVAIGRQSHRRHFGCDPRGFWLPECAYRPDGPWRSPLDPGIAEAWRPGLERVLEAQGLGYFFVETHLVEGGAPLAVFSPDSARDRPSKRSHAATSRTGPGLRDTGSAISRIGPALPLAGAVRADGPYRVGGSRVLCFGRDAASSQQVWSHEGGYPGDPAYRDFHRRHHPGGLRYWAVTDSRGALADKSVYEPAAAARRVRVHAEHLLAAVAERLHAPARGKRGPQLCAMYDTELFGHWWFEGPGFLAELLDRAPASGVTPGSPESWLGSAAAAPALALPEGSWGTRGSHQTWFNSETRALWREVHDAETSFEAVARRALARGEPLIGRVLGQALRELLLLESSDWPFLITHRSVSDYALERAAGHGRSVRRLLRIASGVLDRAPARATEALPPADERFLAECETKDGLFDWVDWRSGLAEASREPTGLGALREPASATPRFPAVPGAPAPTAGAATRAPAPLSRRGRGSSAGSIRSRAARRPGRASRDS
jgi:1,4-alpha-glucan branching enzyme